MEKLLEQSSDRLRVDSNKVQPIEFEQFIPNHAQPIEIEHTNSPNFHKRIAKKLGELAGTFAKKLGELAGTFAKG